METTARASTAIVIAALVLAAPSCRRTPAGGTSEEPGKVPRIHSPGEWPSPSDVPPAGTKCGDMTAAQCLLSAGCVLEAVPKGDPGYVCRDAAGPCEGGVAQFPPPAFEADCKARPGCRYVEADCFCPTARTRVRAAQSVAISCACGGGPPHRCIPSSP